jgi:hypothetical protein
MQIWHTRPKYFSILFNVITGVHLWKLPRFKVAKHLVPNFRKSDVSTFGQSLLQIFMCAQVAITPFIDPIIMLAEIIQIGCGFRANRIMHFVKTYLVSNPSNRNDRSVIT